MGFVYIAWNYYKIITIHEPFSVSIVTSGASVINYYQFRSYFSFDLDLWLCALHSPPSISEMHSSSFANAYFLLWESLKNAIIGYVASYSFASNTFPLIKGIHFMHAPHYCVNSILSVPTEGEMSAQKTKKNVSGVIKIHGVDTVSQTIHRQRFREASWKGADCSTTAARTTTTTNTMDTRKDFYVCIKKHKHF